MLLILLLNNDIHAAKALGLISPSLQNHQIKIFLSQEIEKNSDLPMEIAMMRKVESKGASEKISQLASQINAEIVGYENINSTATLQKIKELKPDLIISIRFGQILKQPLIDIPKFGVINLHSGILPDYRGVMATFWAILHSEKEIGTTLHYIRDAGIDTGDIISFSRAKIDFDSSLLQNISNLYFEGCTNIVEFLKKIEKGEKIETTAQNKIGGGKYFSYPKAKDVQKFLQMMRLF